MTTSSARTVMAPVTSRSSMIAPFCVTSNEPLGVSVVPGGTPVFSGPGWGAAQPVGAAPPDAELLDEEPVDEELLDTPPPAPPAAGLAPPPQAATAESRIAANAVRMSASVPEG
jgi:hypothetical protein